jgi:hypothetical protein
MVTLYHFNHSCHDCVPGHIFSLIRFRVANGSEFANDYEEWQQSFPEGLSVFGMRHMTPDQPFGEVPPAKVKLEMECEDFRKKYFADKPSRFQSFFAMATLDEAIAFRDGTKRKTGLVGSIWEIDADSVQHRGDMRLLTPDRCSEANLRAYWEGRPLDGGEPTWECLVIPPVKMIRCIVPVDHSSDRDTNP